MNYLEVFLDTYKSEKTKKAYRRAIYHMLHFVGKNETLVQRIDLVQWKNSLQKYETAGQAQMINAVKSYFRFLEENEIIEKNPASKIHAPKIVNKPKDALTKEEAKKMLECAKNPRDKAIIALYLSTGMRVQELVDIQLFHYQEDPQHLVFKTKGGKFRKVTLNPDCQHYINEYLKVRKDGVPNLFVSNQHSVMKGKNISAMLKKVARLAEIDKDVSNHTFRSTFVTDIAMEYGITTAQVMVGHSDISTTRRYVRGIEDQVQEIMGGLTL